MIPPHAELVIRLTFRLGERLATRWRHLARRRSLLEACCAGLEVERGERVLAGCRDRGDGYALVATDRALYHRTEPGRWSRLGWERVTKVTWDGVPGQPGRPGEPGGPGRFVITAASGTAPARLVVPARERGVMPELAAERMTHAYLGRWSVPLGDGQHILVEARRRPGTGSLLWAVVPNGYGRELSDGGVRGQVELALARLTAEFGELSGDGRLPVSGWPRSCGTAGEAE